MNKISPKELAKQLYNIGPVMAEKLIDVGIDTPEKLRKVGAKEAFIRIHHSGGFCGKFHAAYLYALEGAIRNCNWLDIPEKLKKEYKKFTEDLRTHKIDLS